LRVHSQALYSSFYSSCHCCSCSLGLFQVALTHLELLVRCCL
jgi:hypothetical protein